MYFLLLFCLALPKFDIRLSSSVQRVDGSLKKLIANVGIAKATIFKSTSLPYWDRSLPFQVCSLCQTLALIPEKAFLLELPIMEGKPRYFSYCQVSLQPHNSITSPRVSLLVLCLKIMVVLSLLMHCRDAWGCLSSRS